ncbi:hypothetical protein V8G54_007359 [Vigna mungo]|uniref:Uncharacterized protein n=1 Tax=Vigna mungo TaxID=3915 RepID=A0AAQ3P3N4_VIGMU
MGKMKSSVISSYLVHPAILLFLLLLSQYSIEPASCASRVKFLPGFEGPLPFLLETGYVGVGESDDVQTFYYFIESNNNPKEDPLLLWLSGGHGCSSLTALLLEIGPLAFKQEEYNGGAPNLILRNQSWNKVLDSLVSSGDDGGVSPPSSFRSGGDAKQRRCPANKSNKRRPNVSSIIYADLPVKTGFSYARTELAAQRSDKLFADQAHQFLRKWLIDHPNFLSSEVYIAGASYSGIPLPAIVQEIVHANEEGIQPRINLQGYLLGDPATTRREANYRIPFAYGMALISEELYETYTSLLMTYWANDNNVQTALNVRKGSIGTWIRCNQDEDFKFDIPSSVEYHANLSKKGYRSLIYNGDHDLLVPFLGTQEWIRSLNYSIVDDWRPWNSNGQVAGYTRTYSNRMTFATVKASI